MDGWHILNDFALMDGNVELELESSYDSTESTVGLV